MGLIDCLPIGFDRDYRFFGTVFYDSAIMYAVLWITGLAALAAILAAIGVFIAGVTVLVTKRVAGHAGPGST
jgi:hypothetical protein